MKRDFYLSRLISKRNNGFIKIITGIRRCGKSYLLFNLYKDYLNSIGIDDGHIIRISLDQKRYEKLRNPNNLYKFINNKIENSNDNFYIFIDEIQLSYKIKTEIDENLVAPEDISLTYTTFYDVLIELMANPKLDIYVTGSNSRTLSKDVATNFRDRGQEITVYPLSFSEYFEVANLEKYEAWEEYKTYGGMPIAVLEKNKKEKAIYLQSLFSRVYLKDIKERYNLNDDYVLEQLIKVLYSAIGSLTNPHKLTNSLLSLLKTKTSDVTIKQYLNYLEDAFLFKHAERFDIKGKSYFDYPMKYYSTDIGLRNACLNFRQIEPTHIMENIIYNELIRRNYSVDVGVIEISEQKNGKQCKKQHEIDFVVNSGSQRIYIQSAFSIDDEMKRQQEIKPLLKTKDSFRKIVIVNGMQQKQSDEFGIDYIGIIPFLLDENII